MRFVGNFVGNVSALFVVAVSHGLDTNPAAVRLFLKTGRFCLHSFQFHLPSAPNPWHKYLQTFAAGRLGARRTCTGSTLHVWQLSIERQMSSRDAGDPCQVHRYPGGIFHISCKMMAFPWASGCWNHWNGKVTCPNWYLQILDKGQRGATLEWAVNYKRIWGTALTPWFDLSWTTSQRVFIPLHTSDCIVPCTFLCNAKSCQSPLSFWSFSSWARVNVGRSPLLGVGGMGGSPS